MRWRQRFYSAGCSGVVRRDVANCVSTGRQWQIGDPGFRSRPLSVQGSAVET